MLQNTYICIHTIYIVNNLYIYIDDINLKLNTLKPLYLGHVDKWFLKIYSLKQYRTNFKNQLSTCSR
jgi:hypothetical protein